MATLRPRYRTAEDRAAGRVSGWAAVFYDPTRAPARKYVTLRTRKESTARQRLADMEKKEAIGLFDPWADPAPEHGVTISEAVGRYVKAHRRAGRSPHTTDEAERIILKFEKSIPAGRLLAHAERRHVERFIDRPKTNSKGETTNKEGVPFGEKSPATKKRLLAVLSAFFAWCVSEGLRKDNPAAIVEAPTAKANRRDHLTEAEEAAVIRKIRAQDVLDSRSRQWLIDWIEFGTRTGLRPGEQQNLQWSAVNLDEQVVHIGRKHRTKTERSTRTVPVKGTALEVLRRRAATRGSESDGPVFTGEKGGRVAMRFLSKSLTKFATRADLEKNITAYSMRHSFGTRMANAGVPFFIIARLMGTSVRMIEQHYAAYAPDSGAAHLERVFGHAVEEEAPAETA